MKLNICVVETLQPLILVQYPSFETWEESSMSGERPEAEDEQVWCVAWLSYLLRMNTSNQSMVLTPPPAFNHALTGADEILNSKELWQQMEP